MFGVVSVRFHWGVGPKENETTMNLISLFLTKVVGTAIAGGGRRAGQARRGGHHQLFQAEKGTQKRLGKQLED